MLPNYSEEEISLIALKVGLTGEQLKTAGDIVYGVYQYLGDDIHCTDNKSIKRRDLIEICLDASRPESIEEGRGNRSRMTPELLDWFRNKSMKYNLDDVYGAIAAVAFKYSEFE
jgi:hypothetical protein